MSEGQVFPVPEAWAKRAHMDAAGYDAAVRRVEADPQGYWRDVAARIDWITPFTVVNGWLTRMLALASVTPPATCTSDWKREA